MLLGHLLVMAVPAPATHQLPLLSSGKKKGRSHILKEDRDTRTVQGVQKDVLEVNARFRRQTAPVSTATHRSSAAPLPARLPRGEPSLPKRRGARRAPPPPPPAAQRPRTFCAADARLQIRSSTQKELWAGDTALERRWGADHHRLSTLSYRGDERTSDRQAAWHPGVCSATPAEACGGGGGEVAGASCSLWQLPVFPWPLGRLAVFPVPSRRRGCGGEVPGVPFVFTRADHGEVTAR